MRARSAKARRTAGSTFGSSRPAGGAELGELPSRVPVQRPLPGQRPGEVAEHRQRRERLERVARIVVVVPFERVVGMTSML